MKTGLWSILLLSISTHLIAVPLRAAPEPMTRSEIISLSKSGVGYSYWWGHGRWRTDGAQHGSCSGSCPDCTHSGSYGADCSGFVAKVWQVPSPSPVTTNSHPYSTSHFRWNTTYWSRISRDAAKAGDAAVYRNSKDTGGHVVLYESGDPWGSLWTYECRGCSYGCVHNSRTLGDVYIFIKRDKVTETPSNGTARGAVFVDVGKGTDDMSQRLPGAKVTVSSGKTVTADSPDALWAFSLKAGDYTISATADGYQKNSRSCTVSSGADAWCSIGLFKEEPCKPNCESRECGPDPTCGESCGSCSDDHACNADGQCVCQPDCGERECGPDPVCGTSCGTCSEELTCDDEGRCSEVEPSELLLRGYVVNPVENDPEPDLSLAPRIGGATVSLEDEESVTSDKNGYFEFRVEAGEYLVSAVADGSLQGEVTCQVRKGETDKESDPCYLAVGVQGIVYPDGGPDTETGVDAGDDKEMETDTGESPEIDTTDTIMDTDTFVADYEIDTETSKEKDSETSGEEFEFDTNWLKTSDTADDNNAFDRDSDEGCGCSHVGASGSPSISAMPLILALLSFLEFI